MEKGVEIIKIIGMRRSKNVFFVRLQLKAHFESADPDVPGNH